jgi:hypothetical protein
MKFEQDPQQQKNQAERDEYVAQIKTRKQEADGGRIKSFAKDLVGKGVAETDLMHEDAIEENRKIEIQKKEIETQEKADALGESFKAARNAAEEIVEHFQTRKITDNPNEQWLNKFVDHAELDLYISEHYKDIPKEEIETNLSKSYDTESPAEVHYSFELSLRSLQSVVEEKTKEKIEKKDSKKLENTRNRLASIDTSANENTTGEQAFEEIEINGEKVQCRRVDMLQEFGAQLATADSYRKKVIVSARQATEREEIFTSQDGMKNYADPGDWIIHNPGDKDPYVFGSKKDSLEVRQQKFAKNYETMDEQPGQFRAKGIVKAVQVNENIVFGNSWGETMAVKSGGWVTDRGSGIAQESFMNTYEKISPEELEKKSAA